MFLLDDVLLAPGKAAFVLFQELARKAQEEWLNDDTVKQELQQLYEMLESGRISDQDFEAKECRLLERLEQIARIKFQDKWGTPAPTGQAPIVESSVVVSALDALPPMTSSMVALPQLPPMPQLPPAPPEPPPMAAPAPPIAATPPPAFVVPPLVAAPPLIAVTPPPVAMSPPPVAVMPPPPVAVTPTAPTPAPVDPSSSGALTMGQVIECAVRALAVLKMRVSSITSVMPEDDNWRVTMELVERRGVPDTSDVLGLYELRLDRTGNVLRYERTQMRRRCDFSR
jgi:hypothetical protein